jgi:hypothetical protein
MKITTAAFALLLIGAVVYAQTQDRTTAPSNTLQVLAKNVDSNKATAFNNAFGGAK